ncbi:unnamed protein product [Symbiodinium sp. CCMP2592]|nr:unnamed protein product [Symbiodinium sp. CCMP2592]
MRAVIFLGLVAASARFAYHDNELRFWAHGQKPEHALNGLAFIVRAFKISKGQDPEGNIDVNQTRSFDGNDGTFHFRIGRQRTNKVAIWYSNQMLWAATNDCGELPHELNFAFKGELLVRVKKGTPTSRTYLIKDVLIAQGGNRWNLNMWYFGGRNCVFLFETHVDCRSEEDADGKVAKVRFYHILNQHEIRIINIEILDTKQRSGNKTFLVALPATMKTSLAVRGDGVPSGSMTLPVERAAAVTQGNQTAQTFFP